MTCLGVGFESVTPNYGNVFSQPTVHSLMSLWQPFQYQSTVFASIHPLFCVNCVCLPILKVVSVLKLWSNCRHLQPQLLHPPPSTTTTNHSSSFTGTNYHFVMECYEFIPNLKSEAIRPNVHTWSLCSHLLPTLDDLLGQFMEIKPGPGGLYFMPSWMMPDITGC